MRTYRARWLWTVLMALAVLSMGASTANAAGARTATSTPGLSSLSAVSCPVSWWCMAVGSYVDRSGVRHAQALTWNGRYWRALRNPPGGVLRSVSCSSASFCMARSDLTGRTEVWNGHAWRAIVHPKYAATAPSCGSWSRCMLINGRGFDGSGPVVESWNGFKWRTWWQKTSLCPFSEGDCFMAAVSCGTAASCAAFGALTTTGGSVQSLSGMEWNRTRWTYIRPPLPSDGNPATVSLTSCSGAFCMTAGSAYQQVKNGDVAVAFTWNAKTDSVADVSPNLGVLACGGGYEPCAWARALACGDPANCMAITYRHGNLAWNGSAWKAAPFGPAGARAALRAVSCHAGFCMAVGHRIVNGNQAPLTEFWNGKTWRILRAPNRAL